MFHDADTMTRLAHLTGDRIDAINRIRVALKAIASDKDSPRIEAMFEGADADLATLVNTIHIEERAKRIEMRVAAHRGAAA